jgi:alpha 1,2-mannosyltransferase
MDFWRGDAYTAFFDFLENKGGFYYEVKTISPTLSLSHALVAKRWGDAPVHSIAAALFLPKDKIHFFNEIGYEHAPYTHCPRGEDKWKDGRCSCDQATSFGEHSQRRFLVGRS